MGLINLKAPENVFVSYVDASSIPENQVHRNAVLTTGGKMISEFKCFFCQPNYRLCEEIIEGMNDVGQIRFVIRRRCPNDAGNETHEIQIEK